MNEKFEFINASQGIDRAKDSFTGFFSGEAITQTSCEESVLTIEKIQEMMKLISTPATTRNPFFDAFNFKPEFTSLVDEDQKPDHIHRMMYYPIALSADRTAIIVPNAI